MFKKTLITAALTTCAMLSAWGQEGIRLPDIGDSSGAVVSRQDEQAYGDALMREFRRLAHLVEDPLIEDYVRDLGFRLVSFSDEPERRFNFFVVDDPNVNAFAAPGGHIGVHSELIVTADDESELAAVLAHEVAHVTQRHLARAIEEAQQVSLPLTLLMLGAILAGGGDGDVIQSAIYGSQGLMQQMLINFTRANEHEADRVGIQVLAQAGYDPEGMSAFFGKMARLARNYGNQIPEFLRTHPVESTRIAEAKNRAKQVKVADRSGRDPSYFLLIRERVRVLTSDRVRDVIEYYASIGVDELHEAYGLALARLRDGDPVGASQALDPYREQGKSHLPVEILRAQIESRGKDDLERFEQLSTAYPRNHAVSVAYAEELLRSGKTGQAEQAESMLRPLLQAHINDAALFLVYSRAADQAGEAVRASEAHAHYVFLQGRVFDAVTQLRNLLKSPGLSYYERSRIEARLARMEPILAEIQREHGWDPSEGKGDGRRRAG